VIDMPDVFDVLGTDHREVQQMLTDLEGGPTYPTGASEAQLADRKKTAEQLIIESSRHEAVEEQYFWPTVRDRLPDGDRLADHAISQESEAKEVLAKLDKADPREPEFEQLLAKFIPAAREHIGYEEGSVWPPLRSTLTAAEAEELGSKLIDAKKTAPTRPHPKTPANPAVLKTAGPAAAVADKVRDAMTGRGDG
jgi:hemerythrin-like domain-containing protein